MDLMWTVGVSPAREEGRITGMGGGGKLPLATGENSGERRVHMHGLLFWNKILQFSRFQDIPNTEFKEIGGVNMLQCTPAHMRTGCMLYDTCSS